MRVAAGSAVLAAVVAGTVTPAVADPVPSPSTTSSRSSSPTPTPTPTTPRTTPSTSAPTTPNEPPRTASPTEGDGEPNHPVALSGAFLAAQIAEADRIAAALTASNSEVAAATREMDALSDKSNALLESLVAARETERAANDEALSAHSDLVVLEGRLATARQILRDWVFSVYSGGGGDADIAGMLDAMSSEPDAGGDPLGDLSYLTEQRSRALQDVKVLTAEQVRPSAPRSARCARCRSPRSRRPARSPASSSVPAPRPPRRLRSACATPSCRRRSTRWRSASRAPTTAPSTPTA